MWKALDDELIPRVVFDAALAQVPHEQEGMRQNNQSALFLFQYADGLLGSVFMLPEFAGGTSVALKLKGQSDVLATRFDERTDPHYPHFAYLLKGIERMIHTGRPSYPEIGRASCRERV